MNNITVARARYTAVSLVAAVTLSMLTSSLLAAPPVRAAAKAPRPFICMYGHSDNRGVSAAFAKLVPRVTVIEGTSADARFIRQLRDQGCIYAAHVNNPLGATTEELVAHWRAPFDNDLNGRLPGGYDAIAIDELRADPDDSQQSQRVCRALATLRSHYPEKQIYAAATWHLGREAARYSQQLRAVYAHVDRLMLEVYLRETRPAYAYFAQWADRLKAVEPGLLQKTVFGLGIAQRGYLYDDTTEVGFFGHLDRQFHAIRSDPDAATMPGVMFWVYYRSQTEVTPEYVARLADHYYLQRNTTLFRAPQTEQLIANGQFETLANWLRMPGRGGVIERFRYEAVAGLQNDHDDHGWSSHGDQGLKMVRGETPNRASYQIDGLVPGRIYTISAWLMADRPGRRAGIQIIHPDGRVIASQETDRAGRGTQWNEWSRLLLSFAPTGSTIAIRLHDTPAAPGTVLYWDFIELESPSGAR